MMVIRGDLDQTERRALFDDNTLTGGATGVIFPADRCTWTYGTYNEASNTYVVEDAAVIGSTKSYLITNAELGFIGKSGRFVPMTQ